MIKILHLSDGTRVMGEVVKKWSDGSLTVRSPLLCLDHYEPEVGSQMILRNPFYGKSDDVVFAGQHIICDYEIVDELALVYVEFLQQEKQLNEKETSQLH